MGGLLCLAHLSLLLSQQTRTSCQEAGLLVKKSRCDIKFVKWLVRKNRALSSKNDDELNEFIDEVTDGTYNLPCVEVIFKLVKQKTAYEIGVRLVGSEMCIRDRSRTPRTFPVNKCHKSVHRNSLNAY